MADRGGIRQHVRGCAERYRHGFPLATGKQFHHKHGISERHVHRFLGNGRAGNGGVSHRDTQALGKWRRSYSEHERSPNSRNVGAGSGGDYFPARFPAAFNAQAARAIHRGAGQSASGCARGSGHDLQLKRGVCGGIHGARETIAVLEDSDLYSVTDWNNFRGALGLFGYTSGTLSAIHPPPPSGPTNCLAPGPVGDDFEATLDAEWASAAAPNAMIEVAACANSQVTFGVMIAAQNLVNSSAPPSIMSVSYGECEVANGAAANAAYNSIAQQAVAEGVSVFAAAGDEGAASCDAGSKVATHGIGVSGLASSPYNVAVGGTDFADASQGTEKTYWNAANDAAYGSAASHIPETPWNDTCAGSVMAVYQQFAVGYGRSEE